jgi:E1A-binding protein p400
VSAAEFRSKWKKAKFKSLKGGDVITRDEEAIIHESEAIMDFEWQTPVGLFVDSQRKRKHLEEENFTPNQRKRMRVDFLGMSEMEEEREDENSFVALLDYPSLTSDRKSNSFSFTATQSRNLVKLDKEKKKDTLKSGEKIPPADPWMSAEDAVFCAVVHEYGGNWNLASETLAGLPDGGIYRGRYRNPAHCRERFRQLLFKYTSITSAYPMYEKNGASNMPLKVSEVIKAEDFCGILIPKLIQLEAI